MKKFFYLIFSCFSIIPLIAGAVTAPNQNGLAPVWDAESIIGMTIEFITGIIAALAVLMIVVSGIMYLTSGGDQQRIDTAKKWLTYSIAGLVISILAYVIVVVIGQVLGAFGNK
jgi:glucose uptake protein GlcU